MFCLFDVSGGQKNSMRVLGNGQSIWQKKSLYASRETLSKAGSQSHFGCDTGLLQKCKSVQNRVNEMIVSYSLLIAKPEIYLWNKQQKTAKNIYISVAFLCATRKNRIHDKMNLSLWRGRRILSENSARPVQTSKLFIGHRAMQFCDLLYSISEEYLSEEGVPTPQQFRMFQIFEVWRCLVSSHLYTQTYTHARMHIRTNTHTQTHSCIYAWRTHKGVRDHANMYKHIDTHRHRHIYTYTHTQRHTQTHHAFPFIV